MISDVDFDLLCDECELPGFNLVESPSTDLTLSVLTESELTALMQARSARDSVAMNFLAAGRYNNFIPAAISAKKQQIELAKLNAEPVEISCEQARHNLQGNLVRLTAMPHCCIVNADLVSLLAHLLTISYSKSLSAENGAGAKALIPSTVSPALRNALRTQLKFQSIDLVVVDYDKSSGCLTPAQLQQFDADDILAVVLAWPNIFGQLEDVNQLADWAKNTGSLLIAISNPLSLSYLKPSFSVSEAKVDYLLGELQALGLPQNHSGNSPAFIASVKALDGELSRYTKVHKDSYILPLMQTYMSLYGIAGLNHSAKRSNELLALLVQKLSDINGISKKFVPTSVNECVIEIAQIDIEKALKILAGHNIVFGYPLQHDYPELENCLLIYCSDQHTLDDVDKLVNKVETVVKNLSTAGCPVKPKF